MTFCKNAIGFIYCALLGVFIGFLSWLFLFLVYIGIHLFWNDFILKTHSKLLILFICIIGGAIIGIFEKYIGKYPKTMHEVLAEFKQNGSVEYKSIPKSLIKTFSTLWFGATVGPEAGLTGIIGGLATLTGEFLKFGFARKKHTKMILKSNYQKIFEIPLYGIYNFIDENNTRALKNIKRFLYGTIIFFATFIIFILMTLDKKISFITKFPSTILNKQDILFLIPLFIIGLSIILYSNILDKLIVKIFNPIQKYKILHSIIGGTLLGILAISIPFILFSGEHTLKNLIQSSYSLGFITLILIGIFKLLSLKICVNTGLIGGPIFPIMFSCASIGMACAFIFHISLPFAVAVIMATTLAGITGNSKLTIILIIWFFSINTWPFIILIAFLSEFLIKKINPNISI